MDRTEQYPWDNVEKLTNAGFMGMTIPEEYGGRGLSYFDAVLVIEDMARLPEGRDVSATSGGTRRGASAVTIRARSISQRVANDVQRY